MIGKFDTAGMADNAVVFYHANCSDGFGAAWAFNQIAPYRASNTEYYAVNYNEPIKHSVTWQDRTKCDLWVLDFSFPMLTLVELASVYNQVIVIDHHKSFIDSLDPETDQHACPDNLHIVWDLERSGAGLTWDYLCQLFTPPQANYERPRLINYIEDRDLWKHKLEYTKEIAALIAATPKSLYEYSRLYSGLRYDLELEASKGELLLNRHNQQVEDIVQLAAPTTIYDAEGNKYNGLCSNCTGHFASDVGSRLAEISGTFGGTYYTDADSSTKFSLRSQGDYDVSKICATYGGGGHKNAAGFKLTNPSAEQSGVIVWSNPDPENLVSPEIHPAIQGGM